MPKLLNNTGQTFRALAYGGTAEKPTMEELAVVPPGFCDLTDEQFAAFKKANQEALDLGWVVDNSKYDESKKDVQILDKPKKKKAKRKKDPFKDFE